MIITIDGPSGVGKGTVAKSLAEKLQLAYLDTGSLYRATVLNLLLNENDFEADTALKTAKALTPKKLTELINNPELRSNPEVSRLIPITIAKMPKVRDVLKKLAQEFTKNPPKLPSGTSPKGVILDGRDTGTLIAPNADVKFYLTADAEVRANRRLLDYKEKGIEISYEKVLESIKTRDETDEKNPLIPPPTANTIKINSSNLNKTEVFNLMLSHI